MIGQAMISGLWRHFYDLSERDHVEPLCTLDWERTSATVNCERRPPLRLGNSQAGSFAWQDIVLA